MASCKTDFLCTLPELCAAPFPPICCKWIVSRNLLQILQALNVFPETLTFVKLHTYDYSVAVLNNQCYLLTGFQASLFLWFLQNSFILLQAISVIASGTVRTMRKKLGY